MPYAQGRVYHDADSHLMEPADWLVPFAEGRLSRRASSPLALRVRREAFLRR